MMANIAILLRFFLFLSSNLILFKRTAKQCGCDKIARNNNGKKIINGKFD